MTFPLPQGRAICYSGYRDGQNPGQKQYPSLDQIREDLQILAGDWPLLRLYDCSAHAERVLQVISSDVLAFKLMLGGNLGPEVSNPNCPWGGTYPEAELQANAAENDAEMGRLIALANAYPEQVFSVAVGNESTVDWTDHLVPVERMIAHARRVKSQVKQPVTFCENYVPWRDKLRPLVDELDFISLHTYPLWEYQSVHEALDYTRSNFDSVARLYPDKQVVITEAGWCTKSNGRGMRAGDATPENQAIYLRQLVDWSDREGILNFVFEAFDENWKGSPDPLEPEKHWGLYTADRRPKVVMHDWR